MFLFIPQGHHCHVFFFIYFLFFHLALSLSPMYASSCLLISRASYSLFTICSLAPRQPDHSCGVVWTWKENILLRYHLTARIIFFSSCFIMIMFPCTHSHYIFNMAHKWTSDKREKYSWSFSLFSDNSALSQKHSKGDKI